MAKGGKAADGLEENQAGNSAPDGAGGTAVSAGYAASQPERGGYSAD